MSSKRSSEEPSVQKQPSFCLPGCEVDKNLLNEGSQAKMCLNCHNLLRQSLSLVQEAHRREVCDLKNLFLMIIDAIEDQIVSTDGKQTCYLFDNFFFSNLEKLKLEFLAAEISKPLSTQIVGNVPSQHLQRSSSKKSLNYGSNFNPKSGSGSKLRVVDSQKKKSVLEKNSAKQQAIAVSIKPSPAKNIGRTKHPNLGSVCAQQKEGIQEHTMANLKVLKSIPKSTTVNKSALLSPIPERDTIFETLEYSHKPEETPLTSYNSLTYKNQVTISPTDKSCPPVSQNTKFNSGASKTDHQLLEMQQKQYEFINTKSNMSCTIESNSDSFSIISRIKSQLKQEMDTLGGTISLKKHPKNDDKENHMGLQGHRHQLYTKLTDVVDENVFSKTPQSNGLKKSGIVNYDVLDSVYRENTKKYIPIEKLDRDSQCNRSRQHGTPFSAKSSFKKLPDVFTPIGAKESSNLPKANQALSNTKKSNKKESLRLLEGEIISMCPPH